MSARTLVVQIVGGTTGLQKATKDAKKQIDGLSRSTDGAGKSMASRLGGGLIGGVRSVVGKFGRLIKGGIIGVTAGLGISIGGAIAKGFKRLTAIEDATAKLKGLGNTSKATGAIMDNALAAVKGTAFGMDEAATTAATAVAAGVKPGQQLTKYLRLTADAATIAGTSMSEMGSIINKVTTAGRVGTEELNQLADRGIPIYTELAKHYGVSAVELRKMVSKGKVSAKDFQSVMQKIVGGSAEAAADTTSGAFKNMGAAVSRVGAALLGGAFPYFKKVFNGITSLLDSITEPAAAFGDKIGKGISRAMAALKPAQQAVSIFAAGFRGVFLQDSGLPKWAETVWSAGQKVASIFTSLKESAGNVDLSKVAEAFSPILTAIKGALPALASAGGSFRDIGAALGGALAKILPTVGKSIVSLIASLTTAAAGVLPAVVAAFSNLATVFTSSGPAISVIVGVVAKLAAGLVKLLTPLLSNEKIVTSLIAAYVGWKAVSGGINLVKQAIDVGKSTAAWVLHQKALLLDKIETAQLYALYAKDFAGKIAAQAKALVGSAVAWARETAAKIANGVATRAVAVGGAVKAIAMQTAALARSAAAWAVQRGAMLASAVAQKAVAAGQWLINAAMSANPIGLVIAAIALLVTGLIIAYKKSATFRKIVNGAFQGVKAVAGAVLGWLSKAVRSTIDFVRKHWSLIKAILGGPILLAYNLVKKHWGSITGLFNKAITFVKSTFKKSWNTVSTIMTAPIRAGRDAIGTAWTKTRGKFSSAKTWVSSTWKRSWSKSKDWMADSVKSGRDKIGTAWTGARSSFSKAKDWVGGTWKKKWGGVKTWMTSAVSLGKKGISSLLGRTGLQATFSNAVKRIGAIWDKIKGPIMKPVKAVIGLINKYLIKGGINWLLTKLGVPKGEQIPWIPDIPKFQQGGAVLGGSWQQRGRDRIPAMLDHDEHVWTRAEVRKFGGHRKMELWRRAIMTGKAHDLPPGFAAGGRVRPVPGGFGHFPSYPGHTGVDFPVGTNTPVHAVMAGMIKSVRALTTSYGRHIIQSLPISGNYEGLYAHLNSFAVRAGQRVGAGQVIGHSDNTGNSTGPHLHFTLQHPGGNYVDPTGFLNGGDAPSGGGAISAVLDFLKGLSPVEWLKKKVTGVQDRILGFLGKHPWARGLARVPGLAVEKGKAYLQKKFFDDLAGGDDPGGSGVARWRGTITQALRMNGLPTSDDYVNAWLRQVASESGGNNKITQQIHDVNSGGNEARGLLQVIPPTFNAYKFPGYGDIFNGLSNALAAIHYAKSRYGKNMLGVIGHGHGYDQGGWLMPGTHVVHNNTGKPEPILTDRQWSALTSNTNNGPTIQITVQGALDPDAVARQIESLMRRHGRVRNGVQLGARTR